MGIVVWWLHIQSGQFYVHVSCMLVGCLPVVISIILINLLNLVSTSLRLPENDADALKHLGVLTMYKVLIYMCVCVCGAFFGLDNKLHKMHIHQNNTHTYTHTHTCVCV